MVESDHSARRITDLTGIPVITVDYRLCHGGVSHPVPHDDAWAAYRWVRDGGHGIATDSARIGVGGASAGACLAGTLAIRGRDENLPPAATADAKPTRHAMVVA